MTIFPRTLERATEVDTSLSLGRIALGVVLLVLMLIPLATGNLLKELGAYGYPAVFLISLISNATLFLPGPGIALVIAAGATLDPIIVGIVAGSGAAIGEMSGYLLGHSGHGILSDRPIYWRIEKWMRKCGTLVIFTLAAVPNPLFDAGGLIAGALRMPVWKFLVSVWLGKCLRFAMLAAFGAVAI